MSAPAIAYSAPIEASVSKPVEQFQTLTVSSDVELPVLDRGTYTVVTGAQRRQEAIINNPGQVASVLSATQDSKQIHDPHDGTVFYPLSSWGFQAGSNGFHTADRPTHNGTDFQSPSGTEIYAVAAGVVIDVGAGGAYGNYAVIEHKINGHTVTSLYAHQVEAPVVQAGDKVEALELVGHVGSTGRSTGPHLHLEITVDGAIQDPASWLSRNALR